MVFVKKSTFFWYVSFIAKSHKVLFFDILDKKKRSLDLKSEVLTKVEKNRYFAKGLVHGFCQKIDLFLICFFSTQKARKKHSLIFWIGKNAFWTSIVKFYQSRKKSTFSKAISPWFLSKSRRFFHLFFFWAKKARKKDFLIFWIEKNTF